MPNKKDVTPRTALVNSFTHQGRHYEQRLVNCGKPNCSRCSPPGHVSRPSHGPYWYLCAQRGKRWRRVYIGKELDTTKYVDIDGHPDWPAITRRRPQGTPGEATTDNVPGQLDAVDEAALRGPNGATP